MENVTISLITLVIFLECICLIWALSTVCRRSRKETTNPNPSFVPPPSKTPNETPNQMRIKMDIGEPICIDKLVASIQAATSRILYHRDIDPLDRAKFICGLYEADVSIVGARDLYNVTKALMTELDNTRVHGKKMGEKDET